MFAPCRRGRRSTGTTPFDGMSGSAVWHDAMARTSSASTRMALHGAGNHALYNHGVRLVTAVYQQPPRVEERAVISFGTRIVGGGGGRRRHLSPLSRSPYEAVPIVVMSLPHHRHRILCQSLGPRSSCERRQRQFNRSATHRKGSQGRSPMRMAAPSKARPSLPHRSTRADLPSRKSRSCPTQRDAINGRSALAATRSPSSPTATSACRRRSPSKPRKVTTLDFVLSRDRRTHALSRTIRAS